MFRAAIRAGEKGVLFAQRNLADILPISGGMSSSVIAGILYAGRALVSF
jgi:hypothetical protein